MLKKAGKILLHVTAGICIVFVVLVIGFTVYEGLILYKHDMDPNYAKIDRCLELGGKWDSDKTICVSE